MEKAREKEIIKTAKDALPFHPQPPREERRAMLMILSERDNPQAESARFLRAVEGFQAGELSPSEFLLICHRLGYLD